MLEIGAFGLTNEMSPLLLVRGDKGVFFSVSDELWTG